MFNWGKFKNINGEEINKQIAEMKDGDFEPIPVGKYEVTIEDMVLKETKENHYPMLVFTFKVLEGEYKNRKDWANFVLLADDQYNGLRMKKATEFLASLDSGYTITFENPQQFEKLINDIAAEVIDTDYVISITLEGKSKKYRTYKVLKAL